MEKRFLAILFLATVCCRAQLPVVPMALSTTPGIFDFNSVANLYIELFALSASDWSGNTNGGTTLGTWLDRTSNHNDFTNAASSTHFVPGYRFGSGPTNGWFVEFSTNTTAASGSPFGLQCVNSPGSNQPNTVFMVAKLKNNPSSYFDAISGSREQFVGRVIGGSPNNSTMYAGTVDNSVNPIQSSDLWCVFSFTFNGTSSYVRTNGVAVSGGLNPGTGGLGKMLLGHDQTFTAPYASKMAAVLVYGQAMSTNDLQAVEKNLSKMFGHIYSDGL